MWCHGLMITFSDSLGWGCFPVYLCGFYYIFNYFKIWNGHDLAFSEQGKKPCKTWAQLVINIKDVHGIGGSRGGLRGCNSPFQISKIKVSNKTKQKIGDNPLEKEEERKSCTFVEFLCVHALIRVSTNIFLSKFSSSSPPFKKFWIRAYMISKKYYTNPNCIATLLNWFLSPEPMSRLVFDWHLCLSLFQNHWTSFNQSYKKMKFSWRN